MSTVRIYKAQVPAWVSLILPFFLISCAHTNSPRTAVVYETYKNGGKIKIFSDQAGELRMLDYCGGDFHILNEDSGQHFERDFWGTGLNVVPYVNKTFKCGKNPNPQLASDEDSEDET